MEHNAIAFCDLNLKRLKSREREKGNSKEKKRKEGRAQRRVGMEGGKEETETKVNSKVSLVGFSVQYFP